MRSKGAAAAIALAGTFLVLGVAGQRWELISLVLPITAMLTIYLLLGRSPELRLEARWTIGAEKVMGGDEVEVVLTVKNIGASRTTVAVKASLPEGASVKPSSSFLVDLEPEAEDRRTFKVLFPRRGRYRFGPLEIMTANLFGLTERVIALDSVAEVRVLPRTFNIRPAPMRDPKLKVASGNIDSKMIGQGLEFYSLRPYVPLDSYRTINWKASARSEDIIVNQYMTQRSQDITIALNAASMDDAQLLESGIEMAAALSAYYLKQRDRVGLSVFGKWTSNIKPGYGRRQLYRIQEGLVDLQVTRGDRHFKIAQIIQRYHPRDSAVIMITDVGDVDIAGAVRRLTDRGRAVTVLTPFLPSRTDDVKSRMRNIRREDCLYNLSQICPTLEWDASQPVSWPRTWGGRR